MLGLPRRSARVSKSPAQELLTYFEAAQNFAAEST